MEYSPKKMKLLLEEKGFKFYKKFGQNFIVDENIIKSIVKKSQIDSNTLVIEIGPGAGSLTNELASLAKKVICYEIDERLKPVLKENIPHDNVDIHFKDFLKEDIKEDIKNEVYDKLYVVANLPYYITTPIIIKFIEENIPVDKIVVMVQKEVGNRLKAQPGTKDYGSLTVYLNYYFEIKKLLDVSRNVFLPKPNVDSIIVEFNKKSQQQFVKNEDLFFKLVRDSFKQKRKTIRNNLKDYNLKLIETILKNYEYDLNIRAEQLSLEHFVALANGLSK